MALDLVVQDFLSGCDPESKVGRQTHLYAITNWHVIVGAGHNPVIRLNKRDGQTETLKTDKDEWKHHRYGDDLAAYSINLSHEIHAFSYLNAGTELLSSDTVASFVGPGSDTVTVGRFITHDGEAISTIGNVAMMHLEPIRHEYGIDQEAFLVESRSMGGYSGSPVFTYSTLVPINRMRGQISQFSPVHPQDFRLLGILCGHMAHYEPVLDNSAPKKMPVEPKMWVDSNAGMSVVIPSWRLRDPLYDEES